MGMNLSFKNNIIYFKWRKGSDKKINALLQWVISHNPWRRRYHCQRFERGRSTLCALGVRRWDCTRINIRERSIGVVFELTNFNIYEKSFFKMHTNFYDKLVGYNSWNLISSYFRKLDVKDANDSKSNFKNSQLNNSNLINQNNSNLMIKMKKI